MNRNERAVLAPLFFGSIWLWKHLFSWYGWESFYAIGLAMATTFVLALAGEAVMDTWPRRIPPGLEDLVASYEAAGWHRTRTHPWWQCHGRTVARKPHVHMMQGGQPMIVTAKARVPPARLPEGS